MDVFILVIGQLSHNKILANLVSIDHRNTDTDPYFFSTAPAVRQSFSVNETAVRPILINNVTCAGTETRLTDCPHNGLGTHNCSHTQDAAVSCPGAYH